MARKVAALFGGVLRSRTGAILASRLSQTPTTCARHLCSLNYRITGYGRASARLQSVSMNQAKAALGNVVYAENACECAEGADALVIATE